MFYIWTSHGFVCAFHFLFVACFFLGVTSVLFFVYFVWLYVLLFIVFALIFFATLHKCQDHCISIWILFYIEWYGMLHTLYMLGLTFHVWKREKYGQLVFLVHCVYLLIWYLLHGILSVVWTTSELVDMHTLRRRVCTTCVFCALCYM